MTPNDVNIVADNIDDFIEVPDGVGRLRKAVLTLAVSGKLVQQDKGEGTADDLCRKIQEESVKQISGRRKKDFSTSPIDVGETSFELPKSWRWVRLGDIVRVDNGYAFKSSKYVEAGSRVIRITNVQDGFIADSNPKFINGGNGGEFADFQLHENDLLMSLTGYVGRVALFPAAMLPAVLNQRVARVAPFSEELKPYIFTYFQSGLFRSIASASTRGMAQQNMSTEWLKTHPIPFPPLAEQKRIVKKVEEVMKQLDELETKKRGRDETRTRLARSAMHSLGKGESKIAFEHLAELTKTPADLKELEGALLTLAESGKLLSQDKKEGTAGELYAKIQSEIENGVKGRKKNAKESTPISPEELPFDLPKSWKWVRLMEIGKLDTGKTPRTGVTGNYAGDIPFVGPGDVQQGKINSYSKLITKRGASESKYLYPGDVLMVCIGGTIGKTALVTGTHTFNQQINKITPCLVDSTFLFCVFQSGYFQRLVWSKASGGATPLVNLTRWSSCVVPLPPLAEQKRIVKKVEEIILLINRLKQVVGEK